MLRFYWVNISVSDLRSSCLFQERIAARNRESGSFMTKTPSMGKEMSTGTYRGLFSPRLAVSAQAIEPCSGYPINVGNLYFEALV